ncbi:hypothetical protein SAMN04487792_1568 [Lactobacillus bombicola]|uniref:Uncharacterized protein n=1 Tax=Lactobacillus bombicola TaxID=1505723 RepID=A0A1I1TQH9_9LACO|nr:hypothetical protein [Lactobacillus bombicola]SFD60857.1 hypothetical protein SAMN04487792_1568 [Lactobacillus bombicola]
MKQFKDSTVTSVGQSLISSVNEGRDKMIYTRAVLSTQDINSLTDEQLTGLTELTDQRQSSPITIIDKNTNTINIGVDFKNNNVTSDYQFNSVGWYAKGTQDNPNEILFAVTPSVGTQTMPAGAHNAATASIRLNLYIALDYNTQVQANPTTSGAINGNDLQAGLNGLLSKGLIYTGNEIVNNDDVNNYHNTAIININGQTVDNMPDGFSGHGYLITVGSNDTQKDGCHLIYDSYSNHIYVSQFNGDSNNWSTWQRLANKKELDDVINDINEKLDQAGKLKKISVNGDTPVEPDETGVAHVNIPQPDLSGFVKKVNNHIPDQSGNVDLTDQFAQKADLGGLTESIAGKVGAVNGVKPDGSGNVSVPTYAANLLKGTSEQTRDIPPNTSTDVIHLTTFSNTKYTVAVDIDYGNCPSGTAGCKLQVNNRGILVDSETIAEGTKGRVSITFTTLPNCPWVKILLTSNSSYTGKYSCLKASQWQDNNTPPDMTWLPSPDDTGGVKTIDGYRPDSNGNITLNGTYETTGDVTRKLKSKLSTLDQPDFVISTNETLDVDKVASGVFVLNGCSLISSNNGSDTFVNVNLSTYNYGWLIVSNYNGAMLERLILTGTFNDVIGVYIRGFNAKNYFNNSFKQILK